MIANQNAITQNLMSEANRLKVNSGLAFDASVTNLLQQLEASGVIKCFRAPVNYAHGAFAYSKQYKADYIIETIDSKIIVVRSSSSFRQDRIKLGFYDLAGILKNDGIGKDVVASIYLVGGAESSGFNKHRRMFARGEYYCPATHLFYLAEFVDFLNEYKLQVEIQRLEEQKELELQALLDSEPLLDPQSNIVCGSDFGRAGNKLEQTLCDLLSDDAHLHALKNNSFSCNSIFKEIIEKICEGEGIALQSVLTIEGSRKITMLKSTGSPKTDIKLTIKVSDGSTRLATLSVKNTIAKRVSCHDYPVEAFIRVLKCENTKLAEYLQLFQTYPKYGAFEENMPEGFSLLEFVDMLSKKADILCEWVTMGKHDNSNLIDPESQISKYLFINNWKTGATAFYLYADYLDLLNRERDERFGVPFAWTYPSGCEGGRIQLKLPIIMF